jgi:2-iminobutanoate/2-iminopropanoate deaminase
MGMVVRNPTAGVYPATDDYVHAVEVWSNIRVILASADMTVDNIVRSTAYLRDPAYAEENAKARVAALGGRVIPTTSVVAQTLVSDWMVEIEVIAAAF